MVAHALILVFVAAEFLQPFLAQLHPGVFAVSAVFPGFPGDDGVAYCGVFGGRVLQQADLPGGLLAEYRPAEFPQDFRLAFQGL